MKESRLLMLSVLFMLLLNVPILTIANRPERVAGIPVLYLYVFGVWAVLIGCIGWLIHRSQTPGDTPAADE
jgi:hypothetical protein